jgi:hypothetical protein
VTGDVEAATEIVPERHTVPGAGLGEAQKIIAAIPTQRSLMTGTDDTGHGNVHVGFFTLLRRAIVIKCRSVAEGSVL